MRPLKMNVITDERCMAYHEPGHAERPQRIAGTLTRLRAQDALPITWHTPTEASDEALLRAHAPDHLHRVATPVGPFDSDTPDYPQIDAHARRSAGAALRALQLAREGSPVFSLMRPPGHHATSDRAMGFCYFNSVAVAALAARAAGLAKVAVFDFDVHHGNGTEAILRGREGCAFFSIHQHPAYPGTGARSVDNCRNYPVPPEAPREDWRGRAQEALADLKDFAPDLVAVSAGFDAYKLDPLCQQQLEAGDFHWMGDQLRRLGVPLVNVLEGGYSRDLPDLIFSYLRGISGAPA